MRRIFRSWPFILSLFLALSFFLPWFNLGFLTLSGYEIPEKISSLYTIAGLFFEVDSSFALYLSYSLYLIPILAITTAIFVLAEYNARLISFLTGSTSIFILGYILLKNKEILFGHEMLVFNIAGIGIYTTFISGLGLLIFALVSKSLPSREVLNREGHEPNELNEETGKEDLLEYNTRFENTFKKTASNLPKTVALVVTAVLATLAIVWFCYNTPKISRPPNDVVEDSSTEENSMQGVKKKLKADKNLTYRYKSVELPADENTPIELIVDGHWAKDSTGSITFGEKNITVDNESFVVKKREDYLVEFSYSVFTLSKGALLEAMSCCDGSLCSVRFYKSKNSPEIVFSDLVAANSQ